MSFNASYNNPRFSDLKIQLAGGSLLHAHRVILANESKMLNIMFDSTDDENTIILDKFPAEITKNIIRSFYTDPVAIPTETEPWILTLKAAAYYMAENLISTLCAHIPNAISVESLLTLGFEYDLDILLENAINTRMSLDSIMIANLMQPFDVQKKTRFLLICDNYMTDYEFLKTAAHILDVIPCKILSRVNVKRMSTNELRALTNMPTIKNDEILQHILNTQLNPIIPKVIKKVVIQTGPYKHNYISDYDSLLDDI